MVGKRRGYKLPKALCIGERTHKVINYEGHCRIIIKQWIWRSTMELMWVSIPNQRKKECKCIILQNIWIIQRLNNKGIMIFKSRDQEQTLWSRMDKLNRLRGTIDDNLIGRGPTHVLNDIWAGRMNSMIWVRIVSIRNLLNQQTQNDIDKGCQ